LTYIGETKRGTPIFVNNLVADAENIIICGTVVHHYFAGYGGGPKMIMPGCAGYESITRNHALAIDHARLRLHAGCQDGKVDGNPLQQDLREAFKFISVTFLLHTIMNGSQNIIGAVAGEPLQAHAAGCRMIDDLYRVRIREKADLIIVSCGGHPRDINYIQSHKSLHHAFYAVKPDGVIILLAKCPEGIGSQTFLEWFDYDAPEKLHHELLHHYKLNGTTALATMQKARESKVIAVTDLPGEIVSRLGFLPAPTLADAISLARKKLPEQFSTYIMPNGALAVPTLRD
jgi:nickel-dependent lactate racemase